MVDKRIRRAGALIASGTLVSRVLGLVRAMILAYAIGSVGMSTNAFAAASQIPNTIYTLIATGALTAVLVPQITKAALAADGGERYINKLVTLTLLGAGIVTAIVAVFTPFILSLLGAGWTSGQQLKLATIFAFWLLPQILFYSLYTVLGEVLNARSLFGPYAWSPVVNNVLNIAGLIAFVVMFGPDSDGTRPPEDWTVLGTALVAGSFTLGVAVQALTLFLFWGRAGLKFRFDFKFRGIGLGTMGRVAKWTFFTVLMTQGVGFVNASVMSLARSDEAGLAASNLVGLIFVLPHSIITISIVTAHFTRMSENVHKGDLRAFTADLSSTTRSTMFAMVYFSAAMLVLAVPLVRLIQPAASYEIVTAVSLVLLANVVGMVPFSLLYVLNRGFFALSDTRTPFFISVGQSALTLLAAYGAVQLPTQYLTAALSLAISVLFGGQALATFVLLRRKVGPIGGRAMMLSLTQFLVSGVIAGIVGVGVMIFFGGTGEGSYAVSSFTGAFVTCAVVAVAMGLVYAVALFVFRNPEARALTQGFGRFVGRG